MDSAHTQKTSVRHMVVGSLKLLPVEPNIAILTPAFTSDRCVLLKQTSH